MAKYIREKTDLNAKRGYQARGGGKEVADVDLDGFPLHIECKRGKKCNIKGAMEQAISEADEENMAIVISKDDRKPILVTMLLDDWIELFQAHVNAYNTQ